MALLINHIACNMIQIFYLVRWMLNQKSACELCPGRLHRVRGGVVPPREVVVLDPLLGEGALVRGPPRLLHATALPEDLGRLLGLLQLRRAHVRVQLRLELCRLARLNVSQL